MQFTARKAVQVSTRHALHDLLLERLCDLLLKRLLAESAPHALHVPDLGGFTQCTYPVNSVILLCVNLPLYWIDLFLKKAFSLTIRVGIMENIAMENFRAFPHLFCIDGKCETFQHEMSHWR